MKIKIIFDKDSTDARYHTGWGVSYLINETILFDTGEQAYYLLENLSLLDVAVERIETVVLSHNRWDHLGGLWSLLERNKKIKIFACADLIDAHTEQLSNYTQYRVNGFGAIATDVYTTGGLRVAHQAGTTIEEQALILRTTRGLVVVSACSHPGILEVITHVAACLPGEKIYALIGGLHLIDTDIRLIRYIAHAIQKGGIERIGPTHCSGYEAIQVFKELYKERFLDVAVGKEIIL